MSIFDGLSDARVYTACAIVILYLATSAYFLWPRTRRQPAAAAVANEGSEAPTLVAFLIGNDTGIAGLRALLKARIAAARHRNWLLFGERSSAHDRYYREDLDRWRADGAIERIDLIFSRDTSQRRYVQDRIVECADEMRRWVADGAAIYVCGSLQGMAPGVEAALTRVLGTGTVEELAAAGRYRRDVY